MDDQGQGPRGNELSTAERRDLGDGEPPGYVFGSPCCWMAKVVPACSVAFATLLRGAARTWLVALAGVLG